MATLSVLEAYYGCAVVIDYADEEGRLAAIALALRVMSEMEPSQPHAYSLKLQTNGGDDVSAWAIHQSPLDFLQTHVHPDYRNYQVLCRIGESQPYVFNVLSEDGSCVCVGPAWDAPNEWYDAFWEVLRNAGREVGLVFGR